jgi:hypothetical protein
MERAGAGASGGRTRPGSDPGVGEGDLARGKRTAGDLGAWLVFEDETGQGLRPPKARTWSRRGHTPVIEVSGRRSGRVTVAGLACYRPGRRSRLIYRLRIYHRRAGENASFTETDYIRLLDAAHRHLHAPIVLIWDNLNRHISAAMRGHVRARDWLTVIQLPAYTPELNPVEGLWSVLGRSLSNLDVRNVDQLATLIKSRLKPMQYRPALIDGFLTGTGLTLDS